MMFPIMKTILIAILVLHFTPAPAAEEPIFEAARNGDLDAVKSILANDPSKLGATDDEKYTALHWACIRARWDIAKLLIENGADLNAVGGDGGTPLNWAVNSDNVDMIEMMVDRGAGLNRKNRWGMTELHTHGDLAGQSQRRRVSAGPGIRSIDRNERGVDRAALCLSKRARRHHRHADRQGPVRDRQGSPGQIPETSLLQEAESHQGERP
jgi:hypothetical protein